MTIEYLISFLASIGLLIAYSLMVKNKEFWLTMLYCCVPVVNLGYTLISVAKTVEFAIFANDVAYLGSVFLSMCMFLTIIRICGFKVRPATVACCFALGALMFAVVATSPMIPLYYKSVAIETVDGSSRLVKEYGILHNAYVIYLVGYFAAMIAAILLSVKRKKIGEPKLAGFIAGVVCSNIVVWLFEKFIDWNYEFLSVTYIISELLLLLLYWMMQDYVQESEAAAEEAKEKSEHAAVLHTMLSEEKMKRILDSLPEGTALSPRQMDILERILDYKSRKEIAAELHLSENTVKTHTGTLYKALGVSGREEIYSRLEN